MNSTYIVINTEPDKVVKLKRAVWAEHTDWRIKQVAIPYTWYNIKNGSNVLKIDGTVYNLSNGTYTPSLMLAELNSLTSQTWSFSQSNLKFTVTDGSSFELDYDSTSEGLLNLLGFTSDQTLSGSSSYTGANAMMLNRPICIGLLISELNPTMSVLSSETDANIVPNSDITLPIHVNTNFGGTVVYDGSDDLFHQLRNQFSSLTIIVKDLDTGEKLDLNGNHMGVVIELKKPREFGEFNLY